MTERDKTLAALREALARSQDQERSRAAAELQARFERLLSALAAPAATFIVLVKPQFELGPARVGKGGVVRDDASRKEAVDSVARFADGLGLVERGRADSVLPGPKGNREVFLWMQATAL